METRWEGMRNIRTRPHVLEQIFSGEPMGVAAIDLNRHAGCARDHADKWSGSCRSEPPLPGPAWFV